MVVRAPGRQPIANGTIVRYAGGLAVGMAAVLGYSIVIADSRPTVVAAVLLLGVAVAAMVFYVRQRAFLRLRAYAGLTVHATTYLVVLGPLWGYTAALALADRSAAADWAAPLSAMTALWGVGLAVHAFGAVRTHGYDDVAAV